MAFSFAVWFAIVGGCLIALSFVLGWALFRHTKGKVRRMDASEAGRFALTGSSTFTPEPDVVVTGKAVGAEVEMSAGIDDLREAARRGDWKTFWLWPCVMSCVAFGVWSVFTAILLFAGAPGIGHVCVGAFCFLFLFIAWFMPWAAIYTQIDAGTARRPDGSTRSDDAGTPP